MEILINQFLRLKGGKAGSDTYNSYKRTVNAFKRHLDALYDSSIPLSEVTSDDVSSFVMAEINPKRTKDREKRLKAAEDKKTQLTPSPKTVSNRLAILAGLFDVAIFHNHTITNHAKNLRSILGRQVKESGNKNDHGEEQYNKALNISERKLFFEKLIDASFKEPAWPKDSLRYKQHMLMKQPIIARNELLFYLFEATGVRVSGMTGVDFHGIDLDKMELKVREKGNKTRKAPILPQSISDDDMYQRVSDYVEIYRPQLMKGKNHSMLWVNNRGEPMKNWFIQDLCRRAMEAAQLRKPYFGPHLLRHTFATDKLDQDNSPRDVAIAMGHADLQSITTYDSGEAKDARERMRIKNWDKGN